VSNNLLNNIRLEAQLICGPMKYASIGNSRALAHIPKEHTFGIKG